MKKAEPLYDRPMPHSLEAERSVLGAVLLDNAALLPANETLRPEDFFLDQHRRIFTQMLTLDALEQPIDLITLTEHMHKAGDLEAAGGAPYLAALADGMPRVSNVGHYAHIVKEKALLRNLIHATHNIQQQAFEGEDGAAALIENARTALAAVARSQPSAGLIPMKTIVNENFERLEKIFTAGKALTGLASGYSELDRLLSGFHPAELILLAARPSVGKTALALNLAENIAVRNQQPVAFFSLEMSKESLLQRLLASVAQIDAHKFRTGHLSREDWRRMTEALGMLAAAPLWVDDGSTLRVGEMAARAERLKKEQGLALVILDYLQLMSAARPGRSRQEEVSEVSRGLKAAAKDLGVPVLALSQLSRNPDKEERQPMLSDLRESGALEQDADVVLFIHRPSFFKLNANPEEREQTELVCAKQRNGPTDTVRFVFRSRLTRFEEAAPEHFDFQEGETYGQSPD